MSITSANAIVMITVPGIFPVPVQLQGFQADDAFSTAPVKVSENVMGVDGRMSSGFVFEVYEWEIALQADSPSRAFFDAWYSFQRVAKDVYPANMTVALPGIGQDFNFSNGSLSEYQAVPDAKKVLQGVKHKITWERVVPVVTA